MTEHLPDEITYGFVADRVLLAVGDTTDDTDRFPDGVPAKGTVTFTPERDTHYTQQTPATVLQQPIECTIYQGDPDDWGGREDPKRIGLLVDPAGHVGNVALIVGWYSVSYRLERGAAKRFRFQVRPEHTADEPLWLSSVAPLTPSPSERFVVNEKVYTETLAARDTTEQYRDKTLEYRNQAQTARTGAVTAETNAKTHATAAASSATDAAQSLADTQAHGITIDTSVGTRVYVGDTMIYGDTGWRELPLPQRFISGRVLIKRENNNVTLRLEGSEITGLENIASNDYLTATDFIPVGFRPPLWGDRPVGFFMGDYAQYQGHFSIAQQSRILYLTSEADENLGTGNARASGEMSWTTPPEWPTSLPGVPG